MLSFARLQCSGAVNGSEATLWKGNDEWCHMVSTSPTHRWFVIVSPHLGIESVLPKHNNSIFVWKSTTLNDLAERTVKLAWLSLVHWNNLWDSCILNSLPTDLLSEWFCGRSYRKQLSTKNFLFLISTTRRSSTTWNINLLKLLCLCVIKCLTKEYLLNSSRWNSVW